MTRIAFATLKNYDGLNEEKDAVFTALARRGIIAEHVPLEDLAQKSGGFSAIVMHHTSGYHLDLQGFLEKLFVLEAQATPLFNSASIIRWNADKHYLRDLEEHDIPTLPTLWLEQGSTLNLSETLDAQGWQDCVLKPVISAGAFETKRISAHQASEHQPWLDALLPTRAMMLQPFAVEVTEKGEWSFLFFNGRYSHCVLKTPGTGDYRVQHVHGGAYVHQLTPPAQLLRDAEEVMQHLPGDTLYARVDGIERDQRLMVMEVELIEPFLYLLPDTQAVERYADALAERVLRQAIAA